MNTATISLDEYNRLRDRDTVLTMLEHNSIVRCESVWRGGVVIHNMGDRDTAFSELTNKLAEAQFKLQMTEEKLYFASISKKKKWYHFA